MEPADSRPEPIARNERRPRDMAISLLVLLVPIALLLIFYRAVLGGDEPVVVDPAPAVESAQRAGAFPVTTPTGLDDGWRPISATFGEVDGGRVLRIGYVTPDGDGAQLIETNAPVQGFLPTELTAQARPEGSLDIEGKAWQRYTARPGERALVLLEPSRTTVVVGKASEDELRALAGALG